MFLLQSFNAFVKINLKFFVKFKINQKNFKIFELLYLN